jgi:glucose/arabinose dehydrogenase
MSMARRCATAIALTRSATGSTAAAPCEHGSWDRPRFNGYKVVFVPFSGGRPSGQAEDVVTGLLNSDEKARGRPVGLAVDKSGALLIADDVGNAVWRVTPAGQ